MIAGTVIADVTPHVLRHSFASFANELGFTESTVAALLGHAQGTITSRYIHNVDTSLIMAADTVAGYIAALLDGVAFKRHCYAVDHDSRRAAMAKLFSIDASQKESSETLFQTANQGEPGRRAR